ncbi:MAG: YwiB family protein [Desulfitobacteriaceae bacterium]
MEKEKGVGKTQVLISVLGTQRFPEGHEDKMEFVTLGTYHIRQGVFYLVYRESELTGMEGVTTSLRAQREHVVLNRMGATEFKQEFQPGVLHSGNYVTPFGTLWLSVLTKRLECDLTARGGRISLEYDLFVDDEFVSCNGLKITIKEEPPR